MSQTKACPNCLNEVLIDNFLLHQLYCDRNIVKCEKCDEKFDLNELDEHMKTHELIQCTYCKNNYEKRSLTSHSTQCSLKPQQCEYCELAFDVNELLAHKANCGSRTEECSACKKRVKKADLSQHTAMCQKKFISQKPQKWSRLVQIDSESDSEGKKEESKNKNQPKRKPKQRKEQLNKQQQQQPEIQKQRKIQEEIIDVNDFNVEDEDEMLQKAIQESIKYVDNK